MFKLQHPINPFFVNQPFGANGAYYQANGINIQGHNGLDLAAKHGEPVYAAHDGQANFEIDDKGGHGVVIIHSEGYKTIYWHLCDSMKEPQFKSPIEDNPWMSVNTGDIIGYADSTGLSTGDHLHFGLKKIYPNEPPLSVTTVNPDNGYLGAIDPSDYFPEATPHVFNTNLSYGDEGYECVQLQMKLQSLGYFDHTTYPHYGELTRKAVLDFQVEHCNLTWWERYILQGKNVGQKTRAVLNSS